MKKTELALTGVAQLVEHRPSKRKVASSIPGQGTCLGCGPGPQWGACERQPVFLSHINVASLSFPLHSPLSKNK